MGCTVVHHTFLLTKLHLTALWLLPLWTLQQLRERTCVSRVLHLTRSHSSRADQTKEGPSSGQCLLPTIHPVVLNTAQGNLELGGQTWDLQSPFCRKMGAESAIREEAAHTVLLLPYVTVCNSVLLLSSDLTLSSKEWTLLSWVLVRPTSDVWEVGLTQV
jgi:hypothetical protein